MENKKYCALQGFYWMLYCAGYGYVSYYLTQAGYSAASVGTLTALFGIASAILQPRIGRLADKGGRWGWKPQLIFFNVLGAVVSLGLIILSGKGFSKPGLLFGLLLLITSSMMPLVNAACFYYQRQGIPMNFGVARGLGSLFYAVISVVLGRLTALLGAAPVPVGALVSFLGLLVVTLSFPYDGKTQEMPEETKGRSSGFVGKYPAFCLMCVGLMCLLTFHNFTNTYLIQMIEAVGGNSQNMGVAIAIAAVLEIPVMFLFARIVKEIPVLTLLCVSGIGFTVKGVAFLAATSVTGIYVSQIFQMAAFAIYASASVYYGERCMKTEDKVTGQSFVSLTITLGAVLGNYLGGVILDAMGVRAMMLTAEGFAAVGAAIVLAAAAMHKKAGERF